MKKEAEPDYNKQMRVLSKHYRFLEQHYIRLLFEFCEFEAIRACRVLEVLKDLQTPYAFIKKLVDFPDSSDDIIKGMEKEFEKKYGQTKLEIMNAFMEQNDNKNKQQMIQAENNFDFFNTVPQDTCISIMSYLDAFSFSRLSLANSKFNLISKSQALEPYFKSLVLKVFKNEQPQLPLDCRFGEIRSYVMSHPLHYGPNIKNAVTNNLRYYVWKSEPSSFKVDKNYYKSFGSYRNIFTQAPRVNFNGIYVCRHKYVRLGEKALHQNFTPLHIIYYYRYIRFFEDGSLLCNVSSTKCKKQQLSKLLSRANLQAFDPNNTCELKIGQFMQHKSTLYMRIVKANTIFNYQLEIQSTEHQVSNQLLLLNYTLEMVDEKEINQNLYTYKPHKERVVFNYLRHQDFVDDNVGL